MRGVHTNQSTAPAECNQAFISLPSDVLEEEETARTETSKTPFHPPTPQTPPPPLFPSHRVAAITKFQLQGVSDEKSRSSINWRDRTSQMARANLPIKCDLWRQLWSLVSAIAISDVIMGKPRMWRARGEEIVLHRIFVAQFKVKLCGNLVEVL